MRKRRQIDNTPMYAIVNKNGEVFAGLRSGHPHWSANWDEAKFLELANTTYIYDNNPNEYELINREQF
jgi:hypothetical protein